MTELVEIYQNAKKLGNKTVACIARIRSNRAGKKVSFMVVNDGTTFNDLQIVYKDQTKGFDNATKARVSAIVEVEGKLILTPGKPQPFELMATKITVLDQAIEQYPLQKKEHSPEFLREIAHLRARTKTYQAVFKIRSAASFAFHQYFHEQGFIYVQTPILTGNDAEGAGETFVVTTRTDNKYDQDFFGKKATLTVSGQLHAEAYAQAFKKVYTFGPTFRAEESYTSKHAAEFWMIEPEVAFADLEQNIVLIEDMLKKVTSQIWKETEDELKFLDAQFEGKVLPRIKGLMDSEFKTTTYTQAIELLQKAVKKGHKFEENKIKFGLDLATEHERYLCEEINQAPTFVTNYPKEIKAFYMKQNADQKTVAAVDLLVPGIGELVGGSERESDYEKLLARCKAIKIDPKGLDWYLSLRKYGYYKSAGFGLGFERFLMYITGVANIRDVLLYPRTPKNLNF